MKHQDLLTVRFSFGSYLHVLAIVPLSLTIKTDGVISCQVPRASLSRICPTTELTKRQTELLFDMNAVNECVSCLTSRSTKKWVIPQARFPGNNIG